jgi:hypothetical protein
VSAIVAGQAHTIERNSTQGIIYSDAFDVYPLFLSPQMDGRISATTPALIGMHTVADIRPNQRLPWVTGLIPASSRRTATERARCPLGAMLASGEESVEDRRLFRALDVACAASKTPGGTDASEHDAGRAAALWMSALEILAHDGKRADLVRVPVLFNQRRWLREELKVQDREVVHWKKTIQTNSAGAPFSLRSRPSDGGGSVWTLIASENEWIRLAMRPPEATAQAAAQ